MESSSFKVDFKIEKNGKNSYKIGEFKHEEDVIPIYFQQSSKVIHFQLTMGPDFFIAKSPKYITPEHAVELLKMNERNFWKLYKIVKQKTHLKDNLTQEDINKLEKTIKELVEKHSVEIGVAPKKIYLKNLKRAWRIAKSSGNISFNTKLAFLPKALIEYVVIHELCHLKHMNHSKEFWKLVEEHCPYYKDYKKKLKEYI